MKPNAAKVVDDTPAQTSGSPGEWRNVPLSESERAKIIARLTWRFMLIIMGEGMKETPLDPIDHMLALVIGTANLSHIDSSPELCRRNAGQIEPDAMRRGISRGAIARALSMPAETVRRRLNALIEAKILIEREDGIILAAGNPLGIGSRRDLWKFHARQFERLLRELRLRGIFFD
jgi:DNA-binding transcriptional ArsR family regulator